METHQTIIKFTQEGLREASESRDLLLDLEERFGIEESSIRSQLSKKGITLLNLVKVFELGGKYISPDKIKKMGSKRFEDFMELEIPLNDVVEEIDDEELDQLIQAGHLMRLSIRDKYMEKVIAILHGKGLVLFDPIIEEINDGWDHNEFFEYITQPVASIERVQQKLNKAQEKQESERYTSKDIGEINLKLDNAKDIEEINLKLDNAIRGFIVDLLKRLGIV